MSHYLSSTVAFVSKVMRWASAVVVFAYFASLLARACERLPLSVAYANWNGVGASLVALFGLALFHERTGGGRALGMFWSTLARCCRWPSSQGSGEGFR
ncbi:MAG TPA: SMR family transporter [Polyangiaceae bacterium]